jgi:hypothetical protein
VAVIYKVCAQTLSKEYKKTLFIIQVLDKTEQIIRTADEIIADSIMLDSFAKQDIVMIAFTAGWESAERSLV